MSRGVCDVFEMLRGARVFFFKYQGCLWEFYPKIKRLRYHSLKAFKALKEYPEMLERKFSQIVLTLVSMLTSITT